MEARLWAAFLSVEPLGDDRQDYLLGALAHKQDVYLWAKAGGKGNPPELSRSIIDWWGQRKQGDGSAGKQDRTEKAALILHGLGVLGKVIAAKHKGATSGD